MNIKLSDHFTCGKLVLFALPTIGMILVSTTYDLIDGYFVSNYIGKTAFAAINIIYPYLFISETFIEYLPYLRLFVTYRVTVVNKTDTVL